MKNNRILGNLALKILVFVGALVPAVIGADRVFRIFFLHDIMAPVVGRWYLQLALLIAAYAVCTAFLCAASGRHAGEEGVRPGWGTKVPLDLLLLMVGLAVVIIAMLTEETFNYSYVYRNYFGSDAFWQQLYPLYGVGAACLAMLQGVLMSLALRIKLGDWYKNTVCWKVLMLCVRFCKWLAMTAVPWVFGWCAGFLKFIWSIVSRVTRGIFSAIGRAISAIPFIWKGVLVVFGVCLYEFLCLAGLTYSNPAAYAASWIIERLLIVPLVCYCLVCMKRLKNGAKSLADGNLDSPIDDARMVLDFKEHAGDINRIAEGSSAAMEQKLKSERFRTELITNVSHDIKTPITSIINYSDLISKEETDNEKILDYAEVLKRQSEKLKKLLEDLLEASKASTGNLEVNLAPCDACVLVSQAEGEYEGRLAAVGLKLVTSVPADPLYIMADGRRIWRVFDNLMNNVCKYSQEGTRVYLTLEKKGNTAVFSFRNTSREQLNVSADELMERFVRGDASRNTEGSGLGLSIAQSFTELQKGTMSLAIDGDLFKVTLQFAAI